MDWFNDFLSTGNLISLGAAPWNALMGFTSILLTETPAEFSPSAWLTMKLVIYPWFLSAGTILLNFFFLIGFVRQNTNLRENVTIENWIEMMIKVIIGNTLMNDGLSIMSDFLSMAATINKSFFNGGYPKIYDSSVDLGTTLIYMIFGVVYLLLSLICGILVAVEVLGRFLFLIVLIGIGPVGMSAFAGGRGFEQVAIAYIKTFLTLAFQIVIIMLILKLGSTMTESMSNVFNSTKGFVSWFNGSIAVINSMLTMVFITVRKSFWLLKQECRKKT